MMETRYEALPRPSGTQNWGPETTLPAISGLIHAVRHNGPLHLLLLDAHVCFKTNGARLPFPDRADTAFDCYCATYIEHIKLLGATVDRRRKNDRPAADSNIKLLGTTPHFRVHATHRLGQCVSLNGHQFASHFNDFFHCICSQRAHGWNASLNKFVPEYRQWEPRPLLYGAKPQGRTLACEHTPQLFKQLSR